MKSKSSLVMMLALYGSLCADTYALVADPYDNTTGYKIVYQASSPDTILELPQDMDVWKAGNEISFKQSNVTVDVVQERPPAESGSSITVRVGERTLGYLIVTGADNQPMSAESILKALSKSS